MSSRSYPSGTASALDMDQKVNNLGWVGHRSLDPQCESLKPDQSDNISYTMGITTEGATAPNAEATISNDVSDNGAQTSSSVPLLSNQRVLSDSNLSCSVQVIENNVDSALLTALRDDRQRRIVLRLEQMLIDLMNDNQRAFFDIGPGAGNGPNLAPSPRSSQMNGNSQSSPLLLNPPKVQNKFQKLILHRLADRFEIKRENISSPVDLWDWNNSSHQQKTLSQQSSFIIRLIKTPQSRIPKELLIDLFDGRKFDCATKDSDSFNMGEMKQGINAVEGASATNSASATNTEDSYSKESRTVVSSGETSKQRNKMKIMKRRETSEVSVTSQRRASSSRRNNLRGKNQSDKEKAYAEARARIFAESHDDGTECANSKAQDMDQSTEAPTGQVNISEEEKQKKSDMGSCEPSSTPNSLSTLEAAPRASEKQTGELTNEDPSQDYRTPTPKKDTPNNSGSRSRRSSGTGYNSNTSSSSTRNSKATWRNRKEEENDPDFKRGRGLAQSTLTQSLPVNALSGSLQLHFNEQMGPAQTYAMPHTSPQFARGGSPSVGGMYIPGRAPHTHNGYHQQQNYHYANSNPHYRQQQQQQQQHYQQGYVTSHSFATNPSPQDHPAHSNTAFVQPDYRFFPMVQPQQNTSYAAYHKAAAQQQAHGQRQRRSWSPVGPSEHQRDSDELQSYQKKYAGNQRQGTEQMQHFKVEPREQPRAPGSVEFSDLG